MPIQAPQWTDYLNCPVCCREFGAPPRSPISLGCGHTLCRHCLKHLHRKQCPFDQIVDTKKEIQQPKREKIIENRESKFLSSPNGILQNLCAAGLAVPNRYSIQHLAASTTIIVEAEELVVNTALLQLAGYAPPAQPYHPPCVQALPELDRLAYDAIIRCMEHLAVYLKFCGNANNSMAGSRLSRPMQRKLVTLLQCALTDAEGRGRAARAARSLGERTVTELILQHQNPQQLSANLWAAVRARGCQFLGPAMQEEVLKLVLLALEDGSALSRKVLVMFVVQRLEPHFPQASKTSIGHVVQLLYRASCFKVSKRECDSSLMQLKEEFRTYESLRREHDAQIVQIATEAGLRIAPDQWSALLYGDTAHKSHMQSIIDKLQTPQSFAQSVQELFIALQRTGDPAQLVVMSMHLDRLAGIDASPDAKSPTWQQLAEIMTSLKEVVSGLIHYLQQQATGRDSNHNHSQKHVIQDRCSEPASQPSPSTAASTPTHAKYKVSMCRDAATRSFCPRGSSCTFAHSEEELERYRSLPSGGGVPAASNGNYTYLPPLPQNMPMPQNMQLTPMYPRLPFHPHIDNYNVPPMPPQAMPPPALPPEMIPPQEYPEAGHNVEGIQQNYPAPMIHSQPPPPLMNQNGMMIPLADRPPYYGRFGNMHPIHKDAVANNLQYREFPPPVFQGPGNPMYQGQEQIPPIPNIYVSVPHEPPRNISPYQFDDMQSEMMPEYRVKPAYVSVPRERRPDPPWPPANEVFNFEGMRNSLPHCSSSSEDMFNVTSDRRAVGADRLAAATDLSNRADDQELEEELQALERRIDTELD